MSQPGMAKSQWLFQSAVDVQHFQQELSRERKSLMEERRQLEREKNEFRIEQKVEEHRIAQEAHLFELKWKILEEELHKLAKEKQELAEERKKYQSAKQPREQVIYYPEKVQAEVFFYGVNNELGMKKRYKELIKIYHPDNRDGDTQILQMINQEYERLKQMF